MQYERITFAFVKKLFQQTGLRAIRQSTYNECGGADVMGVICKAFGSDLNVDSTDPFIELLWSRDYAQGFVWGYDGSYSNITRIEFKQGWEDGKLVWDSLVEERMTVNGN